MPLPPSPREAAQVLWSCKKTTLVEKDGLTFYVMCYSIPQACPHKYGQFLWNGALF